MRNRKFVVLAVFFLCTCATYQSDVASSRNLLGEGRATEAVETLKPLAEKESRDQLLYLLDYATALDMAGNHKEAQKIYIQADQLAERFDYYSVSQIAAATLTAEEMIQYKGESYEKIFINAMAAVSYIASGDQEAALVEVRRINEKIKKIRSSGREDYEPNSFAHYLSALLWEADRNFDSSYIEYEKAYDIDPSIPGIKADLIRAAKLARRDETYQKWKTAFPEVTESPEWYQRGFGDLIVLVEQGWGPRKQFSPHDYRVPILVPTYSETQAVKVSVAGKAEVKTQSVYDVQSAALETFRADQAWFIARKIGGFIAKDLVAERIRRENEALGLLAWIFMHATDRADLRHWSTLPQTMQVARIRLTPGQYTVKLQGISGEGSSTADMTERTVDIKSGRLSFLTWRTLR